MRWTMSTPVLSSSWWILGLAILATSCSSNLDQAHYLAYLADPTHGLTLTQEVDGATVTCTYRPTDLVVSQELAGDEGDSRYPKVDSVRQAYASKLYCSLSLARDGGEIENAFIRDEAALGQAISYLNNGIAQDVFVRGLGQPDSVAALAATYPRQYGNTGRSTVLLVFPAAQLNVSQGFTCSFRDSHFGLAPARFVFTASSMRALPQLQF